MTGTVVQVSISPGGVPNQAIPHAVVTTRGIVGDGWRHPEFHGTPKRALLLITAEGIEEIRALGFPVAYGSLGENLTTQGLDRRALRLGQSFQCGSARIQLTEPRLPCNTISVFGEGIQNAIYDLRTMRHDFTSPVWGLSGFYASVLEPGEVRPGEAITWLAP